MNRTTGIAAAIALVTCGIAIAQGEWNRSGGDTGSVTLTLGREGKLVTGGQRNSGQAVRVWLGPDGATTVPVVDQAWMTAAGFARPGRFPTLRRAFAVLDAGTDADRGADGVTVADVGRDLDALAASHPDRSRYFIVPVEIRGRTIIAVGDTLGTLFLAVGHVHVPGGMQATGSVSVRTGRSGLPYIVR